MAESVVKRELISSFSYSSLTTDGLTFSGCTYVSGGYVKIGKLVIIEMRLTVPATVSWATLITGFPSSGAREVPLSTSTGATLDISYQKMRVANNEITSTLSGLNVSGIYLTA